MRRLAALAALLLAAPPALAQWPTTSFLPVPPGEESPDDAIASGFDGYATGGDILNFSGETVTVDSLDIGALRRGAVGALTDVMRAVAIDAAKMSAAGFPAPKIQPLLRVESTGEAFYPIFWVPELSKPFRFNCYPTPGILGHFGGARFTVTANGATFSYNRLARAHEAGGGRRADMLAYMTSQLTHEVVHGVQASGYDNDGCGHGPKWLGEGTADGLAYYLASKRISDAFDRYKWMRNKRRYDLPIDSTEISEYDAGSFFRYLLEASESGGSPDMAILRDILTMSPSEVRSRDGVLAGIDRAIKARSGGRGLYRVLPEFLTEYASYGEGRYKSAHPGTLRHDAWIDEVFLHCVDFFITPGAAVKKTIKLQPLSGECVKVTWSDFETPVALQFFAEGAGSDYGALHMGEAARRHGTGKKFCWDATKGLSRRIARKMSEKCILRRGAMEVSAGGAATEVDGWTSDFNLHGFGEAYFVVSNVAKDPAETTRLEFDLVVGALEAKKTGGQHVQPREPGGEEAPVQQGRTNIDKRVHAMSGSSDRILFDGRSIFGQGVGLGFLEGVAGAGGGGEGVFTLVRGGDYWVGWVGPGPAQPEFNEVGFIIKDPKRFESGNVMNGVIMSGGMMGMETDPECGYDLTAEITLIEETRERLRFKVEGDLFDMMRAMGLAGSNPSTCELLRAAFVERAAFEVSLPYGAIYAGDSQVSRGRPPGQEVYDDEEFPAGPSFGGIETSLSLAGGGAPPEDPPPEAPPAGGGGGGGGGGAGGGLIAGETCDCRCPDVADPPTPLCRAQCAPRWAACARAEAETAEASEPETAAPQPPKPDPAAQRRWFSRLVEGQGLDPEVEEMLVEDFATMSDETRALLIRLYRDGVR